MFKVLLTSTSFQDTPGVHKKLLDKQGFDVDTRRGPLQEAEILNIVDQYDALLCGDDELTREVLEKGKAGRLKVVSKYGVGLDKIDLRAAKDLNIPVTNCPGVNQVSVAEHVFALLLSFCRNIPESVNATAQGNWKRLSGREIYGKTMGVLGLGAIGKEVARRAKCFGMEVVVYDKYPDHAYIAQYGLILADSVGNLMKSSDVLSLHLPLLPDTKHMLNYEAIRSFCKDGVIIINTARGELVQQEDLIQALTEGKIGGYLTDVLDVEPMQKGHPLQNVPNVLITPHIGSRTLESVQRQGTMAVENLIQMYNGLQS